MFNTYNDQSPAEIRKGDKVTDSRGRTFVASNTAEEVWGDWHVSGYDSETGKLRAYTIDGGTTVTLTIDEKEDVYA